MGRIITDPPKDLDHVQNCRSFCAAPAYSDNKTLAAGGSDGAVRLWDAAASKELQRFARHTSAVGCVAFSPDGKKLASASGAEDGSIRLFDLASKQEALVLRAAVGAGAERERGVHFVEFSRDSKTLISGGDCYGDEIGGKIKSINTIGAWDATTGKRLRHFRVGDDQAKPYEGATSVALSADGQTVALGYWDRTIRLWDMATGKPIRTLTGYPDRFYPAYHLAFAPNGKALAASGSHHAVCLLDTTTGKRLFDDGLAQKSNIRSVALSPDGKVLATASQDYTVCLWGTALGKPLHELRGHDSWVYTVAFAPDGRTVASGSSDGTVRLWDVATGKEVRRLVTDKEPRPGGVLPGGTLYVSRLAFSPSGKMLAVSHEELGPGGANVIDRGIRLWDPATGKELRRIKAPGLLHWGDLAFSAEGETLIAVADDHTIRRWRVDTGDEISKFVVQGQHSGGVHALSSDGILAARNGYDGLALVWDTATGRQVLAIRTSENTPRYPAFSPDGRYLALGGAAYGRPQAERLAIELWELASGKLVHTYALPPQTGVSSVAFARDGRTLATGMADTTALLWDLGPALPVKDLAKTEDFWAALADDDAHRAYAAIWRLVDDPQRTVTLLNERLKATQAPSPEVTQPLLNDLDSDSFKVRDAAKKKLEALGELAEPALRAALKANPSLEMQRRIEALLERLNSAGPLKGEALRSVRALQVLEKIGTPEARSVLQRLGQGLASASLTRAAKESLARMAAR